MAFKDWVSNLRDYFVDDEEDFEESSAPRQAVKPTVVSNTPTKPTVEENLQQNSQGRPAPTSIQAAATPQGQSVPKRTATVPKTKPLEKTVMNQTITAQQQAAAAISTIAIKEPRAYTDIMEAARIVKNGESVLVNFKFMGDNQSRRSIDFMTGVAFTLDGDVQNVGGQIFLMTPANITVDAAKEMSVLAGQNFESYDIY